MRQEGWFPDGGRLIAFVLAAATLVLIFLGTLWPVPSAAAWAGIDRTGMALSPSTPQGAVNELAHVIGQLNWGRAYAMLDNKGQFTQEQFIRDLSGAYSSLRTYAVLDNFDRSPCMRPDDQAEVRLRMRWSTVVGTFVDTREYRSGEDRRSVVAGVAAGERAAGAAAGDSRELSALGCDLSRTRATTGARRMWRPRMFASWICVRCSVRRASRCWANC